MRFFLSPFIYDVTDVCDGLLSYRHHSTAMTDGPGDNCMGAPYVVGYCHCWYFGPRLLLEPQCLNSIVNS